MLKFHPIPALMKTYTNFKKIFLVRVFWLKYIFRIKFKIPILDMLLPKNSVPFEGLYSSSEARKSQKAELQGQCFFYNFPYFIRFGLENIAKTSLRHCCISVAMRNSQE